jgi:hypothetical protein
VQSGKAEIRRFHAIGVDHLQESGGSKKDRNVPVLLGSENGSQQRGQEVVQKPSEYIAETIPESLRCKVLYAAQKGKALGKFRGMATNLFQYHKNKGRLLPKF